MQWVKKVMVGIKPDERVIFYASPDKISSLFRVIQNREKLFEEFDKYREAGFGKPIAYFVEHHKLILWDGEYYEVDLSKNDHRKVIADYTYVRSPFFVSLDVNWRHFAEDYNKYLTKPQVRYILRIAHSMVAIYYYTTNFKEGIAFLDEVVKTIEKILQELDLARYSFAVELENRTSAEFEPGRSNFLRLIFIGHPLEFVVEGKYCEVWELHIFFKVNSAGGKIFKVRFSGATEYSFYDSDTLNQKKITFEKLVKSII